MGKKALKVTEPKAEKKYISITKLLCTFGTYLRERTKCNLPVVEKCQKCAKIFAINDNIYVAKLENGLKHVICENCGKE